MAGRAGTEVRTGLRALASPLAACSLVVLALNDHVLKQAWPGWVTGKLSDVAGLVLAPLLLGLGLALLGVRRPVAWSSGLVALGFAVTKTTAAGAAVVSAGWSLTGVNTHIVADPTDLLALPAVLVASRLWRQAESVPGRPRLSAVLGVALLPLGVLATAATGACDEDEGVRFVAAVSGRLSEGDQQRQRLLAFQDHSAWRVVDATGTISTLSMTDRDRLGDPATYGAGCAADALHCWRVESVNDVVEVSSDGGRSWSAELSFPADQQAAALENVEKSCGEEPFAGLGDLAVLDTPDGPMVLVAAGRAGAWLRSVPGEWRLVDRAELAADPTPTVEERARGWLETVPPVLPPYAPPGEPTPSLGTPEPATCPPRERATVTPHPANGDPYEVCT